MFPCLKRSCSVNDLADSQALYITKNMLGILGPGKACSSLTPDKKTEVRLSNHRNRNQHQNLHRNAKKGAKSNQ